MPLPHFAFSLAMSLLWLPIIAPAQEFPAKRVRIVVPFPPGAGNDVQARVLANKFQESMGQSFVVENRPGANGLIGAEAVAKSAPDGHTLLFTSSGLAANATLYKRPGFDPVKDLTGITLFSTGPHLLVVHPSVPAKSVKDLIAIAKTSPGGLNAGSNGSGAANHLAIEMLNESAGIKIAHIPYKGGTPTLHAVMAGEIDLAFLGATTGLPHIRAGKLRGLAVTSPKRSAAAPDLPTMNTFLPGYEYLNWHAVFVAAGTPVQVVGKLNTEALKALKAADARAVIEANGIEPAGSTPQEMNTYFKREVERTARVIKAANIKVQ